MRKLITPFCSLAFIVILLYVFHRRSRLAKSIFSRLLFLSVNRISRHDLTLRFGEILRLCYSNFLINTVQLFTVTNIIQSQHNKLLQFPNWALSNQSIIQWISLRPSIFIAPFKNDANYRESLARGFAISINQANGQFSYSDLLCEEWENFPPNNDRAWMIKCKKALVLIKLMILRGKKTLRHRFGWCRA